MIRSPSRTAFFLAGDESRIGTERWRGAVVISPDAIYILKKTRAQPHGHSIVEILYVLAELLADRVLPRHVIPDRPYSDIPEAVRTHPDWPVKESEQSCVVIIPRDEVSLIHHEKDWRLAVRFFFSGVEISILHGRLGAKMAKAGFEEAGWPLDWNGESFNLGDLSRKQVEAMIKAHPPWRPRISFPLIGGGFVLFAMPIVFQLIPRLNKTLVESVTLVGWIGGLVAVLLGWVALRRGL